MRAANSSDATIAILAGDSEVEERKVTVKYLQESDRAIVDSKVELSELASLIQKILVSNKPS
jgi:histidyl-tRNA synthetase